MSKKNLTTRVLREALNGSSKDLLRKFSLSAKTKTFTPNVKMNKRPSSETSSDSSWPDLPHPLGKTFTSAPAYKKSDDLNHFLFPKEEGADFYDPYSELSLFLAQKIKEQFTEEGMTKKWSILLQDKLIEKISPEFQKKFPNYRIGSSALKKLWDKIAYYSQQIHTQKEAVNSQGKLNIGFLIKENLKQYLQLKGSGDKHPFHYAHQLAIKISDCLATLDGIKPMLENLSKTIWFIQKHLLPPPHLEKTKTPYDEMDKGDKLIIKTVLEALGKNGFLSQKELEIQVKESLQELKNLPSLTPTDKASATISFLLAEKLYPTSSFHTLYRTEEKEAISAFLKRHLMLYKQTLVPFQLTEVVRRTQAFYLLAAEVPKNLSREAIETVFQSLVNPKEAPPQPSDQTLAAFLAQESRLLLSGEDVYSVYEMLNHLPTLSPHLLEIVIWKELSKQEPFLDELPYKMGSRFQEEIANILIDNPNLAFSSVVSTAVQFFKRAKDLVLSKKDKEWEEKIHLWTMQGDLICRFLRLETENSLLNLIKELWHHRSAVTNHAIFVSEVAQAYLHRNPAQAPYSPQISARISILYKYAWYALFAETEETSLERFIKWYFVHFSHLEEKEMLAHIDEMAKKQIPLIPLDQDKIKALFRSTKEEKRSQGNEWQA